MKIKFTGMDDHLKDVSSVLIGYACEFTYKPNQITTAHFVENHVGERIATFFEGRGTSVKVERKY